MGAWFAIAISLPTGCWQAQDSRLTLALVPDAAGLTYVASLRNAGEKPLLLVLGTILANDKWICPDRIELFVTGPDGKTHKSKSNFGCNPSGVIGGRTDYLIISLAMGATYSLPVLDLSAQPAGPYMVKARYTGESIPSRNLGSDVKGLSLIHYWTGTVESNTVSSHIR